MASYNDSEENSPLIGAQNGEPNTNAGSPKLSGASLSSKDRLSLSDPFIDTKSTLYLVLLTLSIGGLQIVWSVELSNGSPYLLSLGMSKALVAFVWLAGPMTGVLVQPYIGILSDRSRIRWGKRKPFMIAGALGTAASSLLLAYARQIVQFVGGWGSDAPYEGYWKGFTIVLATVLMWVLDFAINTVQAAIRAFIVDGAPMHQQEAANAWASRMSGIGNVFGYIAGYLDLPQHFSFLGREQFQVLCTFASIALTSTVFISAFTIKERNPQDEPEAKTNHQSGLLAFFKQVWHSIKRLPKPIRTVCEIQFFNWIGWFPFLFYITTYIGQLYVNPKLNPDLTPEEVNRLWARATRIGTLALLVEAIVSLSTNLLLPLVVSPTYKAHQTDLFGSAELQKPTGNVVQRVLQSLQIPGFTLRRAWFLAHVLFSLCMFSTFFISTPLAATVMVGIVGMSWSLSLWAPFALISAEISKADELRRAKRRRKVLNGDEDTLYSNNNDDDEDHEEDRAGIILGLHNVAISAPQVLATLACSLIFKWLQKPRNEPGDVSVAWTLRLAGISGLVAAWFTWKMRESVAEDEES